MGMSGYSGPGSSYPHHPHPHHPQQAQQQSHVGIRMPSPNGANGHIHASDPHSLSAHGHQSMPNQQAFQYDPSAQQQMQSYANGHSNGHVADMEQQQRVQLPAPSPASTSGEGKGHKGNRLRKACDSCSTRKVKCDESGPPCRACAALDIPCTFERPSRRRGPPNRHAEAIKRRRLEESPHISGQSTPSSPTHAAQALAALSSHPTHPPISAESVCDIQTLDLLVNDFFTYIHPL